MHIKLRHFDYMPKQMVKLTNLTVTHRPWLVKSTTFCSIRLIDVRPYRFYVLFAFDSYKVHGR